jgi:hypothetical protein
MSVRLKQRITRLISWWFILQIVLPFTAPLQTLDLHDLFGAHEQHRSYNSPESTTTPTNAESSAASSIAAVQSPAPVRAAHALAAADAPAFRPLTSVPALASSSPHLQQSVLRL